jgi:hypothetical protein
MKIRVFAWLAVLAGLFVFVASAADIDGKWVAKVSGRNGQTQDNTFTFKTDGDKLTGTVSGPRGDMEITDGKVAGDEISFTTSANFGGNQVKMLFNGKVSGDEIKFTRKVEGRDRSTEFTAKKAS